MTQDDELPSFDQVRTCAAEGERMKAELMLWCKQHIEHEECLPVLSDALARCLCTHAPSDKALKDGLALLVSMLVQQVAIIWKSMPEDMKLNDKATPEGSDPPKS